ncbi:MAG: hypothetical protein EZS28_001879 [Streblomastix strix]|uniref:Uncharacterized protein n=1 Tax=Streblomastix strix TaxID=222440 RepID=A0A5J4X770_9EUKA|nr:MAG: hypothetical protein EZS28_001879 [Streblomastix strix]
MNKDSQQIRQQLFEEKKQKERAEKSDKEAQEAALDRKKMKQGFKAQMLLRGEERRRQFDQQKDEEKGIKINKEQQSLFSVMTEHIDGQNKDKDANKQGAGIEQDEDQLNQSNDPRYFGMSEELKNMLFKSVAPRPPTRDMGTEAKIELQNRKGYTDQSSIWDPDSVFQGNQSVEQVKTQEITPRQKTPNKNKIDSGLDRWFNATLGIGPVSDEMVLKSEIAAAHESVSAQKLLQITNKNISNQTKEPTQQISRSISPQFRQINHQAFPYPLSYKSKDPTQSTTQAIIQSEQYKKQIIQEKIKKDQLEKQQKFGKYKRQTQSNDQEASGIIAIWNKQGKENEQQTSDKDLSIPEIIKLSQKQLNESPKKETARKGGINIIKNSYDHPLNVLMAVEAERWKNSSAADFLSTNPLLLSNGTVPAASQSQQKERQRGRSPSPSSKIHSILANQGFDEQKRLWEQSEAKNKQQIQTNSIQQQPQIEQEQEQDNFEPIDIEQNEDAFNINNASTQIGQRRNQVRQSIYQQKIVTHNITQEEREGGREQVISALSKYMEERRMNDSNPLKLRQYEQDQMYKTYDITSMPGQLKKSLVQIPRVISNKLNHQNVKPPSGKQSLTNTLSSNIQQLNGGRIPLSGTLSSNAKSSQSRLLKLSNSQSTSNFIGIEPQITSKRPTSSK